MVLRDIQLQFVASSTASLTSRICSKI